MNIATAQPNARPREAELLSVATRLFRERGYHATSMQDLAEALGMNRGSLYHYIEAKDDLLWRIVSEALERLDMSQYPIVVRLDGTNAEEGRQILADAGKANIHPEATMLDGARRAVELAR